MLKQSLKISRNVLSQLCIKWVERRGGFDVGGEVVEFSLLDLTLIGLVKDGDINNTAHLGSCNKTGILPFVACIVKQCNPNGLGDMQICVKDPTGTVWASVHWKVLLHPEYGRDLTVGAVLLLNTVTTFGHRHKICYLNIIVRNIVKIFKVDICESTDELVQATIKHVIEPHPSLDPKVQDILKKFVNPSTQSVADIGETSSNTEPTQNMEN
ncbi:hypothetical protein DEO72_LG8g217 [Vigna unguiculata]|uniref:Homologous recombination OB-fold protein OB-fold domain-containing protein n=1 Tax=Vigna unguiculata TaxID=3917 RepID=A0A4D6ML69_VIGUN|nr:hypothetical protein DEO72_LG8g217 [Vigna unguiculata]